MKDVAVTIVLPNGGARSAEVPDDIPVRELLAELTSLLQLPTTGPDGRPMGYRLDSKALGRELREDETLAGAGVPAEDRLVLTADITAGGVRLDESPRMRRLRADYDLMTDLAARSDVIRFEARAERLGLPPERYIVTFRCRGIAGVDRKGGPKFQRQASGGDLPAQPIPAALARHALADAHLAPQYQPPQRQRVHRRGLVDRRSLARPPGADAGRDDPVQELPRRSDAAALSLGSGSRPLVPRLPRRAIRTPFPSTRANLLRPERVHLAPKAEPKEKPRVRLK